LKISLENTTINLAGKTILVYGEHSKVFSTLISFITMSKDGALLFLDSFNMRALSNKIISLNQDELSRIMISGFESLVELDKSLERSETMLLKKGSSKLLAIGSLPSAYIREISLHTPLSHSSILYLLNKILAFFSFLSREYGCVGIIIGPMSGLEGDENIPAKRIFLYWFDYLLELRGCNGNMVLGRLKARSGEEVNLCIPGEIKELSEIRMCNKDDCPRSV
jgi:hypothetical protein